MGEIAVTFTVSDKQAEKHGEDVTVTCDELDEEPLHPTRLTARSRGDHVASFDKSDLVSVEGV